MFKTTCSRLGVFRWALVTHRRDLLPFPMALTRRAWKDQRRYVLALDSDKDSASRRAPDMVGMEPSEPMGPPSPGVGALYRFPAREDGDMYFETDPSERESTRPGVKMNGTD